MAQAIQEYVMYKNWCVEWYDTDNEAPIRTTFFFKVAAVKYFSETLIPFDIDFTFTEYDRTNSKIERQWEYTNSKWRKSDET